MYGTDPRPASLFEDDGSTYDFDGKGLYNTVTISVIGEKCHVKRDGSYGPRKYDINRKPVFVK